MCEASYSAKFAGSSYRSANVPTACFPHTYFHTATNLLKIFENHHSPQDFFFKPKHSLGPVVVLFDCR